jgi:hypothetical protein
MRVDRESIVTIAAAFLCVANGECFLSVSRTRAHRRQSSHRNAARGNAWQKLGFQNQQSRSAAIQWFRVSLPGVSPDWDGYIAEMLVFGLPVTSLIRFCASACQIVGTLPASATAGLLMHGGRALDGCRQPAT